MLEVEDTGIGVEEHHLPRLTERFYRVDKARSREVGGTGLGLAIVKHVLMRHDATLDVQSQLDAGSTFICRFPASRLQAVEAKRDVGAGTAGRWRTPPAAEKDYACSHNAGVHNQWMKFLDRSDEMCRLDGALQRPGAFAVIWGRRRVGKSRLLIEWSRRHGGLYTVADQSAPPVQRRYLATAVATRFPGFADVEYPDWHAFLTRLANEAERSGWRGPFVLDELPYLIASDPGVAGVLQNWLDRPERQLCVVVSGSSLHMMHGAVLDAGAPLYGRAVEAFVVRPLRPGYLSEVFAVDEARELVSVYALWGGMPRYWELAEPFGRDLESAVDSLVLDPAGPLHGEADRLLLEEIPPATALRPLLDTIGAGAHRVSEIAGRLGRPASSLSRPLASLVEMQLVRRETPFGSSPKSGKRSLYRIADPFLRLWFPGRCAAPSGSGGGAARDPAALLAPVSEQPGSVRLGRAKPHVRADAAPRRHPARSIRTLRTRPALLARQCSRVRCRRALGRRPSNARGGGQVDCEGGGRGLEGGSVRACRCPAGCDGSRSGARAVRSGPRLAPERNPRWSIHGR